MIHVIGDRRNTGFCIKCGTTLMIPWNDYQCCPGCTKELEYHKKVAEKKTGKTTKVGKKILTRYAIMRQRKPIGGIPQ